jgi:hypothetical protein
VGRGDGDGEVGVAERVAVRSRSVEALSRQTRRHRHGLRRSVDTWSQVREEREDCFYLDCCWADLRSPISDL